MADEQTKLTEEELLKKIADLTSEKEELVSKLEEKEKAYSSIKERLDKANELSQALISRYALKDTDTQTTEKEELSLDEKILKAYNGEQGGNK